MRFVDLPPIQPEVPSNATRGCETCRPFAPLDYRCSAHCTLGERSRGLTCRNGKCELDNTATAELVFVESEVSCHASFQEMMAIDNR